MTEIQGQTLAKFLDVGHERLFLAFESSFVEFVSDCGFGDSDFKSAHCDAACPFQGHFNAGFSEPGFFPNLMKKSQVECLRRCF